MLSSVQLFDLFLLRIIAAVFPCARMIEIKRKGEAWKLGERIKVFIPLLVLMILSVLFELHVMLCLFGLATIVVTFLTTATDDFSRRLTKKFHNFLRSLNSFSVEIVTVLTPFKTHFQSATLPIVLPPPRRLA